MPHLPASWHGQPAPDADIEQPTKGPRNDAEREEAQRPLNAELAHRCLSVRERSIRRRVGQGDEAHHDAGPDTDGDDSGNRSEARGPTEGPQCPRDLRRRRYKGLFVRSAPVRTHRRHPIGTALSAHQNRFRKDPDPLSGQDAYRAPTGAILRPARIPERSGPSGSTFLLGTIWGL